MSATGLTNTRAFALSLLTLVFTGCTHAQRPASSPAQSWPPYLTNDEKAQCRRVAWKAAGSDEMRERFKLDRVTTERLKLDDRGIQFYLDQKRFDRVEVAIPSGGHVGWHSTYIGVTIARGTYKVLGMHESFWP